MITDWHVFSRGWIVHAKLWFALYVHLKHYMLHHVTCLIFPWVHDAFGEVGQVCMFRNPVVIVGDFCVDTWFKFFRTTVSPADDTKEKHSAIRFI